MSGDSCSLGHRSGSAPARVACLALAFLLLPPAERIRALPPGPPPAQEADSTRGGPTLPPTRLYVGMWSTHLRDLSPHPTANWLIAVSHRGYFAGTFVNSFEERGWAGGVQRDLLRRGEGSLSTSIGARAGLVSGYDERLLGIGDRSPLFPFLQLLWNVDWHRLGVEFSWSGIVVSAATNLRLGRAGDPRP
jgi:hypothetical protein